MGDETLKFFRRLSSRFISKYLQNLVLTYQNSGLYRGYQKFFMGFAAGWPQIYSFHLGKWSLVNSSILFLR